MSELSTLPRTAEAATGCLAISPLTGTFGAEVSGIRLADDNSREMITAVRDALDKY
ncbi:hypothetical protein [Sphingopyxis flava]|uniref:Uncharacterized protein n=1 Tax=Sphingopyxis flava TaxID=1507287 RepID=A0A1T5G9L6_9SPHN|nr:hypothetical protein [Sphingopyxis flava]SKC05150.1 hypothetical protein SAMN06295937_10653 [Sphingopyxis flava]